jgi:hypothetical protein
MPPKQAEKKVLVKSDKLTQGEKKKIKNDNKAKANPEKAAAKKEKNDAKRAGRYGRSCFLLQSCGRWPIIILVSSYISIFLLKTAERRVDPSRSSGSLWHGVCMFCQGSLEAWTYLYTI